MTVILNAEATLWIISDSDVRGGAHGLISVSSRYEIKGGINHNFVKFPGQNNKYCLFLAIQGGYCTPIPPSGRNTVNPTSAIFLFQGNYMGWIVGRAPSSPPFDF
jgi:hypothetical protein